MNWISIKDRIPESRVSVILYNGSSVTVGYYAIGGHVPGWVDELSTDSYGDRYNVDPPPTHWMPLPDPPDEAKE